MVRIKTKEQLRLTFKELLTKKEYSKITVKEVSELSGLTRQIFYYYFNNVHELLKYFFDVEIENIVKEYEEFKNFEESYLLFFKIIEENKVIINNLNHCSSCGSLRSSFESMSKFLTQSMLNDLLDKYKIKEEDKDFIICYHTFVLSSIAYDWVCKGMKENKKNIVNNLSIMLQVFIDSTLIKFENK